MERVTLHDKTFKPFISESVILDKVKSLGTTISVDYGNRKPLFVVILNGAFMFASDLFKELTIDCEVSFVKFSSYEGTQSTGKVNELIGLDDDIQNRHVIIVEDIVDTGNSMNQVMPLLRKQRPASVEICTLLFKPEAFQFDFDVKYVGHEIGNDFVVGYGLDYDGLGRNIRELYVVQ